MNTLTTLSKKAKGASLIDKALKYTFVFSELKKAGVTVTITPYTELVKVGKTPNGNYFSLKEKKGTEYKFTLNGKQFVGRTTDKLFSLRLTLFVSANI